MQEDFNAPVDAVIMWVDGADPDFIASQNAHLQANKREGRDIINSAARHRDNGELRYALRGLIHHAPWIRKIHVVTNGQLPSWLRFDGDKIAHVKHADIFPDPDLLPCFNSFAIESCVHRIEGLAETFVRLSDDFFITRPASKQDILGARGFGRQIYKGKVQSEPKNRYQHQIKNNAEMFATHVGYRPTHNYGHAPQVRTRATFDKFVEQFTDEINITRKNRFRASDDLIPLFLYPYFHAWLHDRDAFHTVIEGGTSEDFLLIEDHDSSWYQQIQVGREGSGWRRQLKRVVKKPPLYLNINDSFNADTIEEERATMAQALDQLFPKPTDFEITPKND